MVSANGSGSSCGISVIFTDETSLDDSPGLGRKVSSREGSLKLHQRPQKSLSGNSNASPQITMRASRGGKPCNGHHHTHDTATTNARVAHNGVELNVHTAGEMGQKRTVVTSHKGKQEENEGYTLELFSLYGHITWPLFII